MRWTVMLCLGSGLIFAEGQSLLAQATAIQEATSYSAGIEPDFDTTNFEILATVNHGTLEYPAEINVGNFTGQTQTYSLALTIPTGNFTFGSPGVTSEQVFRATSTSGTVEVNNEGSITFQDAMSGFPGTIGNGAIQATAGGVPFGGSSTQGIGSGGDGQSSREHHGERQWGSPQLRHTPRAVRILYRGLEWHRGRVSAGQQDGNPSHTHAGGNVTVTTSLACRPPAPRRASSTAISR